ncbi:zinc-binding dehydrogenase [Streptomyces sp. NPDC002671]
MRIADLPEPGAGCRVPGAGCRVPGTGEIVVDVVASPVLPYTKEVLEGVRDYPSLLPIAPGPGPVGRVRAVGPDATRVAPGDWVLCDPTVRSRDAAVAPDIMLQGLIAPGDGARRIQSRFRHGGFAERMLAPLENVTRLGGDETVHPGGDPASWAAVNTLAVPYGGLRAAGLQPGETVLISGATGNFGSAGVSVAMAMGAGCVVAPGRNKSVLDDLVERFGPRVRPVVLTGREEDDTAAMRAAAPGPIDRVLDMLPPISDTAPVRAAVLAVRPGGSIAMMGGVQGDLALPYSHLMRNSITVRGQYMYPRDAPGRLAALVRAGLLPLDHWRVTSFPLDEANEAVQHAAAHASPFTMTVICP